jgi:hypothetical protein
MDRRDLKEKLLLAGITAAVFLPLRLAVNQYLTEHWLGSLGVATLVSFCIVFLIKKNRLGVFGSAFKNQAHKLLWGGHIKFVIAAILVFMVYFGATILLVERGNTTYYQDKEILYLGFADKDASVLLNGPENYQPNPISYLQYLEYVFAISYAMINDATQGWLVNLHLVLFTEQVEALGLLWFYRKMFGSAERSMSVSDRQIKKIAQTP